MIKTSNYQHPWHKPCGRPHCKSCGNPCKASWRDFGIGGYEYGSEHGNHQDWQYVSECCEDRVVDCHGNDLPDPPRGGSDFDEEYLP